MSRPWYNRRVNCGFVRESATREETDVYRYAGPVVRFTSILSVLPLVTVIGTGCATEGQSGALAGGGIGALTGLAIGGNTEAALTESQP